MLFVLASASSSFLIAQDKSAANTNSLLQRSKYSIKHLYLISFTIGETNTKTLSSASHMITQGFQQPYKATLNLKVYLQGYYMSGEQMENVLYNQGVTLNAGMECDTIEIQ